MKGNVEGRDTLT